MTTAAELNTAAALTIGRNLRWTSAGGSALSAALTSGRTSPPSAVSDGFAVEDALVAYVALDLHGASGRPAAVVTYTDTPSSGDVIGIAIDGTDYDHTVTSGLGETALAALTGLESDINAASGIGVTASVEDGVLYVRADDGRQHAYAAHSGADIDPTITVEPSYAAPQIWLLPEGSDVWRIAGAECSAAELVDQNTLVRVNVAGIRRVAVQAAGSDGAWTWRLALADASST